MAGTDTAVLGDISGHQCLSISKHGKAWSAIAAGITGTAPTATTAEAITGQAIIGRNAAGAAGTEQSRATAATGAIACPSRATRARIPGDATSHRPTSTARSCGSPTATATGTRVSKIHIAGNGITTGTAGRPGCTGAVTPPRTTNTAGAASAERPRIAAEQRRPIVIVATRKRCSPAARSGRAGRTEAAATSESYGNHLSGRNVNRESNHTGAAAAAATARRRATSLAATAASATATGIDIDNGNTGRRRPSRSSGRAYNSGKQNGTHRISRRTSGAQRDTLAECGAAYAGK